MVQISSPQLSYLWSKLIIKIPPFFTGVFRKVKGWPIVRTRSLSLDGKFCIFTRNPLNIHLLRYTRYFSNSSVLKMSKNKFHVKAFFGDFEFPFFRPYFGYSSQTNRDIWIPFEPNESSCFFLRRIKIWIWYYNI